MFAKVKNSKFVYILTLVVFLAQLMMPSVASAHSLLPPTVPVTTRALADDAAPTAEPAADAATPEPDAAPTEEAPAPTEAAPTEEAPAAEPTPAEVLAELPAGTDVVVLDQTGDPVPLATQAAADAIIAGDPKFCIGAGFSNCSGSFDSLNALLSNLFFTSWLQKGTDSGTVYIASNYDKTKDTQNIRDNYSLANITNDLTFQGGWDFGTNTIDATNPYSTFDDAFDYMHGGNLIFKNIVISGVGAGPQTDAALTLRIAGGATGKTITLDNVNVVDNPAVPGAVLWGWEATKPVDVSVSNSHFDRNLGWGLRIRTYGDASLSDVTASDNTGLDGSSDGGGAEIKADAVIVEDSTFSGNKTGTGIPYDVGHGLAITGDNLGNYSAGVGHNGNINLTNVTANGNGWDGAYLDTTGGSGDVSIIDSTFGYNATNGNGKKGLEVLSGGDVYLNSVTANYNDSDGAKLTSGMGGSADVQKSFFIHNGNNGLLPNVDQDLTLEKIDASYNANYGIAVLYTIGGTLRFDCLKNAGDGSEGGNGTAHYFNKFLTYDATVTNCGFNSSGGGESGGSNAEDNGIESLEIGGGQSVEMSCTGGLIGYDLFVPGMKHNAFLPCSSFDTEGVTAQITPQTLYELPAPLDSQYDFVSALSVTTSAPLNGGTMTVSFEIPKGMQGSRFAILHWNGTSWDVLGGYSTATGMFSVESNQGGVFALVVLG